MRTVDEVINRRVSWWPRIDQVLEDLGIFHLVVLDDRRRLPPNLYCGHWCVLQGRCT